MSGSRKKEGGEAKSSANGTDVQKPSSLIEQTNMERLWSLEGGGSDKR